jgi:hypothetical protein
MNRFVIIILSLCFLPLTSLANDSLQEADSLYALRGADYDPETLLADPAEIDAALEAYRASLEELTGPEKEDVYWKLMRCYYFKGNYTTKDKDTRKAIYDEGKDLGYLALEEYPESAGINLWLAVLWGVWAEEYGKMKAAKKGVAGKIRKLCEKTIELDPDFNDAGGYRVLGRVHFKSPKIPLILGWPSKKKAVVYLEQAFEIAPDNLYTKLYLAEALHKRKQRDRAIELAQEILNEEEIITGIVEDANIKKEAREDLDAWEKGLDTEEEEDEEEGGE